VTGAGAGDGADAAAGTGWAGDSMAGRRVARDGSGAWKAASEARDSGKCVPGVEAGTMRRVPTVVPVAPEAVEKVPGDLDRSPLPGAAVDVPAPLGRTVVGRGKTVPVLLMEGPVAPLPLRLRDWGSAPSAGAALRERVDTPSDTPPGAAARPRTVPAATPRAAPGPTRPPPTPLVRLPAVVVERLDAPEGDWNTVDAPMRAGAANPALARPPPAATARRPAGPTAAAAPDGAIVDVRDCGCADVARRRCGPNAPPAADVDTVLGRTPRGNGSCPGDAMAA